jgi:hypothetical protein
MTFTIPYTILFTLVSCSSSDSIDTAETQRCNGLESLCEKSLHEVAFLRTHNAHASQEREYSTFSMNHFFAIPTQLNDGVRALNLDLYDNDGELLFCHGFCDLGSQPASELIQEIVDFLAVNPNEVLLIDLQDESNGRSAEAFALLDTYLYEREESEISWPTLQELIDENKRVLLFGNPSEEDPNWLLSKSDWWYSNGWYYEEPEDLDCSLETEKVLYGFYEVTNVLTNPLAHPDLAESINNQPVIGEHVQRCMNEIGFVNLLSVDFYSIGDGLEVVQAINQGSDLVWEK